ncbi:LapA family protein [Noviherbaspirillum sedimenti]|uniref:LapA family protein n=1 Tax=Noviherbaspirillum sedimenti TaxID=2320865 RepID=A0A3A3GQI2_9BURK|nr:LapA family protein [Noviherbaspirillum sedimenti]RJG04616.1 LapA family protein [Noviherbaspirillum sedimenti]
MRLVSKIIWSLLFIIVFVVALKNMDREATLAFFSGHEVHAPLPLVLLAFTVIGFVLGVLAMTPTFFRQRRDLAKQRKAIKTMQQDSEAQQLARSQPPSADAIAGA